MSPDIPQPNRDQLNSGCKPPNGCIQPAVAQASEPGKKARGRSYVGVGSVQEWRSGIETHVWDTGSKSLGKPRPRVPVRWTCSLRWLHCRMGGWASCACDQSVGRVVLNVRLSMSVHPDKNHAKCKSPNKTVSLGVILNGSRYTECLQVYWATLYLLCMPPPPPGHGRLTVRPSWATTRMFVC